MRFGIQPRSACLRIATVASLIAARSVPVCLGTGPGLDEDRPRSIVETKPELGLPRTVVCDVINEGFYQVIGVVTRRTCAEGEPV